MTVINSRCGPLSIAVEITVDITVLLAVDRCLYNLLSKSLCESLPLRPAKNSCFEVTTPSLCEKVRVRICTLFGFEVIAVLGGSCFKSR